MVSTYVVTCFLQDIILKNSQEIRDCANYNYLDITINKDGNMDKLMNDIGRTKNCHTLQESILGHIINKYKV